MFDSHNFPRRDVVLTIVVATRNAGSMLAGLLESVAEQTAASLCEVIIMDCVSQDNTAGLVDGYRAGLRIDFVSESDSGIYDAWNRALDRSRGEWITFMGADDRFASPLSIERLLNCLGGNPGANLIASRGVLKNLESGAFGRVIGEPWSTKIFRSMNLCHPGLLHNRKLFEGRRFDLRWRIASDYAFLLTARSSVSAVFLDAVTVIIGDAGVSRSQVKTVLNEGRLIQASVPEIGRLRAQLYYFAAVLAHLLRRGRQLTGR